MKYHKNRLSSAGDTIVEVLIAVAVVSLVLAGAYVATRRSSIAVRTAQEQGDALKLAESQIEQVKYQLDNDVVLPGSFCLVNNIITTTVPGCTTGSVNYVQNVTKTGDVYLVNISWPGLSGLSYKVELVYKAS